MSFLSKLFKNPIVQMALPFALTAMMGPAAAMMPSSLTGIFSGMNPMAMNALKQTALGYGTAKLTGSKHPEKAAMYAGIASLPFSYMSAAQGANAYNKQFAGKTPMVPGAVGQKAVGPHGMYSQDIMGKVPMENFNFKKMTPWDILSGSKDAAERATAINATMPGADIFSKTSQGGRNMMGQPRPPIGTMSPDWMPTMASQTAGMYGGRMTDEEEWEAARERRKKELAWMYGVDPDQIKGEMTNPWYSGSFFNAGGIASLENGGGVNGPGSGTSDSIDAKLSDGEFVMTAKAVENLGRGDRYAGARQLYSMMNLLDPESETMSEVT